MIILNFLLILGFNQINQPILAELIKRPTELILFDWELSLVEGEGDLDVVLGTVRDSKIDGIFVAGIIIQDNIGKSLLLKLSSEGKLLWRDYSSYRFSIPHFTFSDVNFDRTTDLIISSNKIIVYDGKTGDVTLELPINILGYTPSINGIDVNNDNQIEIIITNYMGHVKLININQGKTLWERKHVTQSDLESFRLTDVLLPSPTPVIHDINNDKKYEIFISFGLPHFFCLDAKTGKIIWEYKSKDVDFVTPPLVLDCNQDGKLEVIVATQGWYGGLNLYAFDAVEGKIIWTTKFWGKFSGKRMINYFKFNDLPVFMVTIELDNKVYFIEGKEGLIIGEFNLPFLVQNSIVYDIDRDRLPEAIFFSHDDNFRGKLHNMYVYEITATKDPDFEMKLKSLNDIPNNSSWKWPYKTSSPDLLPLWYYPSNGKYTFQNVSDIDGDGLAEIILLSSPDNKEKKLRVLKIIPASKK